MGTDSTERKGRNQARKSQKDKNSRKYAPYADIQHRIIDSPVFRDLSGNDCRLLLILSHQVSSGKNGRLIASPGYCAPFGIGNQHTLKSAIDNLIECGLLIRTLSYSAGGGAALYAVPWRPLCVDTKGLFLEAWRCRIGNVNAIPSFKDLSSIHPHASIDHEVIKSPAFADLKPMSCKLLIIIARQLTEPNNNGHLQASFKFSKRYGFTSKQTLDSAIEDLIEHGFLFLTHRHGRRRVSPGSALPTGWNKYALTWRTVEQKRGLLLDGFEISAWSTWDPLAKKTSQQKSGCSTAETGVQHGKNRGFIDPSTAEIGAMVTAEIGDYVHVPLTLIATINDAQVNEAQLDACEPLIAACKGRDVKASRGRGSASICYRESASRRSVRSLLINDHNAYSHQLLLLSARRKYMIARAYESPLLIKHGATLDRNGGPVGYAMPIAE